MNMLLHIKAIFNCPQDYQNAHADLEKIGLKKVVVSDDGRKVVIPTTAAMGEFNVG